MQATTAPATSIVAPTATLGDLTTIMADLTRAYPEAGHRVAHGAFLAIMGHAETDTATGWWVTSERDGATQYFVLPQYGTCTCQDHARHGHLSPCKHRLAVETIARLERVEAERTDPTTPTPRCPTCDRLADHGCVNEVGAGLWTCDEHGDWEAPDLQGATAADEPCGYWLTDAALELLGELPDLMPQCSRCGSEPAIPSHIDHLGAACIARELFGDDAA